MSGFFFTWNPRACRIPATMDGKRAENAWGRFKEKMAALRRKQREILERFSKKAEEEQIRKLRDQLK
jgi:hypothetical protein